MNRRICVKCDKEIPLNESCIKLVLGEFKKDEEIGNAINFESPKNTIWDTLGYIHCDCK